VEGLSAEVRLARTRQEMIEAENQVKLARAALRELLGVTEAQEWETAPLMDRDIPEQDLSYWQQQMRERRPELKMAGEGVNIAKSGSTAARAGFLPTIQAYSAYEWHGDSFDYTGENWTAGVELRWNLFRGMSDSAEVAAARLQEREAELRRRETENALSLQLESAYYRLQAAREKVKVASAVLQQAEENRRIYADRYSSGMASIMDSLQADAAYSESRLLHLQNLFELYVADAELRAAAGLQEEIITGDAS
jgi:outer membrane protein TolC